MTRLLHSLTFASAINGVDIREDAGPAHRHDWVMSSVELRIRELGGIATTGELSARGYDPRHLLVLAEFGRIVRIRKGWYANNDVDETVILARRVGGVLACMSALAHYGWCEPEQGVLHVSVQRSASRLRPPHDLRRPRADARSTRVIVHWSRRPPTGDRQAVSLGEAIAQAHSCTRERDTL
ncbi:type IV toxin-antitoxin system AbiEi family antitoxin domain-containing protein [Lacisediminihabitans sp. FW035]